MSSEDLAKGTMDQDDEFELDSDSTDDLESAMQEALEAVEKASSEADRRPEVESGDDSGALPELAGPESDVARLEAEISELQDRSLRTMADFDNFRKRVERERAEERRYAAAEVLKEFLKIMDNLERAVASKGSEDDFRTGVELILRQMHELLEKSGVSRIEAKGREFDPRYHEAVSKHESPDVMAPTVSDEMQSGYMLQDRLLRPAIVKVAMPAGGTDIPQEAPDDSDDSEGELN
ncbi:MAG: nucleotide exchange factor GrpE [Acidobacteriota bacterium]